MSKSFTEHINAHNSIYNTNSTDRTLTVKYSIPDEGINNETGILVLVPGYGGHIDSNVYKHIREDFSDAHNYVVLQCSYFGSEFMQSVSEEEMSTVAEIAANSEGACAISVKPGETVDNFNDMGLMQALDIVNATLYVIMHLPNDINTNKIIIWGTSHGAYLAHLANAICPNLYSYLLDISGYVYPYYIDKPRVLEISVDKLNKNVRLVFDYLVTRDKSLRYSNNIYDLSHLYQHFNNHCSILAFQGDQDWMVNYLEKQKFISSISNSNFTLITTNDIDGQVFKNNSHGLGLDYIAFLNIVLKDINSIPAKYNNILQLDDVTLDDSIFISYANIYPECSFL